MYYQEFKRRSSALSRVQRRVLLVVPRFEVYEVMRRGGFDTVTAAIRSLFPRMERYWIAGPCFRLVIA